MKFKSKESTERAHGLWMCLDDLSTSWICFLTTTHSQHERRLETCMLFWLDGNWNSHSIDLNFSLHYLSRIQEKGSRKRNVATVAHCRWHETLLQKPMQVTIYLTQVNFISHRNDSCHLLFVNFFSSSYNQNPPTKLTWILSDHLFHEYEIVGKNTHCSFDDQNTEHAFTSKETQIHIY